MLAHPVHWVSGKLSHCFSGMINSIYDLAYIEDDGSYIMPSGPCMGWPLSRNKPGPKLLGNQYASQEYKVNHDEKVEASLADMASGLLKSTVQIVQRGRATEEERATRIDLCKKCEHFILKSKQCSQCGCYMEAKTWIKAASCPIGSW